MQRNGYIPATALFLLALTSCQPEPIQYNFRRLQIAPNGHLVRLQRLADPPTSASYYSIFRGVSIDMVSHFASVDGQPPRRLLSLSTDEDRRLLETSRIEQISTGPYGTLSLEKKCFFKHGYRSQVSVASSLNDPGAQAPLRLNSLPDRHDPVTEVSLVRITRSGPDYLIAGVTYEVDGRPGGVVQIEVKPGGEQVSAVEYSSNFALREKIAELGLLQQFPLAAYQSTHRLALPYPAQPELQTVVVLRYGFDTILQVETISEGKRSAPMYLKPYVDSEDASLNDQCDLSFKELSATSERTAG